MWETEAENWVRWTRTPGHDAYWYYRDSFFNQILPPAGRHTLEIGCGEGRVTRDLTQRGHTVTAVDSSPTLLQHARQADPAGRYILADAAALPLPDETFDLVVAYNSLMDIDDMQGAVREAARVLTPGGRLCVCITHPMNGPGHFVGSEADAAFTIAGSYLESSRFDGVAERAGLRMRFYGWNHSLATYTRAAEDAGFAIERLREPAAPPELVAAQPDFARWQRLPLYLHLRLRKLPAAETVQAG